MQSTDRAYRRPDRYSIDRDLMTAIDDASTLFPNFNDLNNDLNFDKERTFKGAGGSRFSIERDKNCRPTMSWIGKCNKTKIKHPQPVIDFCCNKVLPIGGSMKQV